MDLHGLPWEVALVCIVASVFFRNGSTMGAILNTVGLAAIIYPYFRMLSEIFRSAMRKIKYLSMTAKYKTVVQKRKKYDGTEKNASYLYLPQLWTENQDTQGKGKIEIDCPKCHTKFIKKS